MNKSILHTAILIGASFLMLACGAQAPNKPETKDQVPEESSAQEISKKEVELFETVFEMEETWLVIKNNENDASIYFQETKPDPVYDAMSITRFPNALEGATNWNLADHYMEILETNFVDQLFDGEFEIKDYNLTKTPGRVITGMQNNFEKTCYLFMGSPNDCIMVLYYHKANGIDYSNKVREMVDNARLSFDGFPREHPESSVSFTNEYGTPTTKCAHPGCSNYIASTGDTNCCTAHSNKCLNCGKYIDEDAAYCMSCLSGAVGNN